MRSFSSIQKVDYAQPSIPKFQAVESVISMNELTQPAVITPENNLHEVVNPANETAVFLDILRYVSRILLLYCHMNVFLMREFFNSVPDMKVIIVTFLHPSANLEFLS